MIRARLWAASLLLLSGPAQAACTVPPFRFHPEQNDNVMIEAVADRGRLCVHRFGEGAGYRFTSLTVSRQPEHGTARVAGGPRLDYRPSAAFTGKDFYEVRICATKDGRPGGCSSLFFVFSVN